MENGKRAGSSRASLLRRFLLVVGGAVGVGAGAAAARPDAPKPTSTGATLQLHGRRWHARVPGEPQRRLPASGDHLSVWGELLDRPHGKKIGEFHGASFSLLAPSGMTSFASGALEMHTFNLVDGTILGIGSRLHEENVFAIVGGTGRYAGALGSYVARQRPKELGGDGTAEFTLTLSA